MKKGDKRVLLPCITCDAITMHTQAKKRGRGLDVVLSILSGGLWRLTTMFKKRPPPICDECGTRHSKRKGWEALHSP